MKPHGNKGKRLTEEHKRKIAAALTGVARDNGLRGRSVPEEVKLKISRTLKGRHTSPETEFKRGQFAGEKAFQWEGGYSALSDGRIARNKDGKLRYRLIVEDLLGRPLKERETIHHINEDPTDDRLENLFLFRFKGAHRKWHAYIKRNGLDGSILKSNLLLYKVK